MDALAKGVLALAPTCVLLWGSVANLARTRAISSILQLLGAICAVLVALTHIFEALHAFPWMHWGEEHSVGHYVDLASAMLALTLFPLGYLLQSLSGSRHLR